MVAASVARVCVCAVPMSVLSSLRRGLLCLRICVQRIVDPSQVAAYAGLALKYKALRAMQEHS
eukprot:576387-Lingulodinium_polyedra.AAC.1